MDLTGQAAVRVADRGDGEGDGCVGLDRRAGLGTCCFQGADQEESLKTRSGECQC